MKRLALFMTLLALALPTRGRAGSDLDAPENLVIEGIPRIPLSLVDRVGRYSEFRRATFAGWHPLRREMLVVTRFADTQQVHEVRHPGGDRSQLTFFRDNVFRDIHYEPTRGESFAFAKDTGGDEFYQLYRYDKASGESVRLTDGSSRNTGAVFSPSGKRLAYGSTRRTGNDVDLYVVDPGDPKTDHLLAQLEGGGWEALDWSPDETRILVSQGISVNESYLWMVDAAKGSMSLITPKDGEPAFYGGARFGADGKGLYVITDAGSEFRRLVYLDLATRKPSPLTASIPWDVDEFELSKDGRRLAFVTNEGGPSVLHVLDTATLKETPLPKMPRGEISRIEWQPKGNELGFTLETSHSPADAYSLNIETGALARWTASETGGLKTDAFSEPVAIHWTSFDGRQIPGFLYHPPARFPGKRPVVVNIHGGPEGQFRPGFLGRNNYLLNEVGVALIFPNVRGSSGYGKTFLKMDNGTLREDAYKDIGTLLDWIRTQPDLDPERIMVMGGSYGGHMTLETATLYSDKIRCSVDVVGISNLVTFLEHTSGYRRDLRRVEYGDERDPKLRAFLERTAPMNNVEKIQKPLFVVAGKNDPRVPLSESDQMVEAVKRIGTPVWYLVAKDEGHGFAKKSNSDFQFYSTLLFMDRFLLN